MASWILQIFCIFTISIWNSNLKVWLQVLMKAESASLWPCWKWHEVQMETNKEAKWIQTSSSVIDAIQGSAPPPPTTRMQAQRVHYAGGTMSTKTQKAGPGRVGAEREGQCVGFLCVDEGQLCAEFSTLNIRW